MIERDFIPGKISKDVVSEDTKMSAHRSYLTQLYHRTDSRKLGALARCRYLMTITTAEQGFSTCAIHSAFYTE